MSESFFNKSYRPEAHKLSWKETLTEVFFCEFRKIFKNTLFYRTPPVAASEKLLVDQDLLFQENKQLKQKRWLVDFQ